MLSRNLWRFSSLEEHEMSPFSMCFFIRVNDPLVQEVYHLYNIFERGRVRVCILRVCVVWMICMSLWWMRHRINTNFILFRIIKRYFERAILQTRVVEYILCSFQQTYILLLGFLVPFAVPIVIVGYIRNTRLQWNKSDDSSTKIADIKHKRFVFSRTWNECEAAVNLIIVFSLCEFGGGKDRNGANVSGRQMQWKQSSA